MEELAKFTLRIFILGILLGLILGLFISKIQAKEIRQVYLDELVYELAEPYSWAKTIKTIIYLESKNGLYPVNLQDPACGITHININTYMKRHKIKNTNFNRNKACSDLVLNAKWAILNAIEELEFWKKIHCIKDTCNNRQYQLIIKSYNAGWNYNSKKAEEYLTKFKKAYYENNK